MTKPDEQDLEYLARLGIDLEGIADHLNHLGAKRGTLTSWSSLIRNLVTVDYERVSSHVKGAKYSFLIKYERTEVV